MPIGLGDLMRRFAAGGILATLTLSASFAQPDRIQGPIDPARRTVLPGHVSPRALPRLGLGALDGSTRLTSLSLMLKKTAQQQVALDRLLIEQQDPASPNYQRWLTPERYADRFGLSPADMAKISEWLTAAGLSVDYTGRARNLILFSGAAAQVEKAFQTRMERFALDGEIYYAATVEPSVPEAVAPLIGLIGGLNNFPTTRPRRKTRPLAAVPGTPLFTAPDGSHALVPGDLATIYDLNPLYQIGVTGAGQKIAVIGVSDFNMADIESFRSAFGLPQNDPQAILVPQSADPGFNKAESETDLDLQWAGALAPNATLIYVNSTDFTVSAEYAVDANLAPVISMSFGICAQLISSTPLQYADAYRQVAQQANAQGITWLVASGDSGAAACDYGGPPAAVYGLDVSVFASTPEVTGVGGTEFNDGSGNYWSAGNSAVESSALGYIPETAWNTTAAQGGLWASGGGVSAYYAKPSWQTGTGVPNDGQRDVPDLALSASEHDPYIVFSEGQVEAVEGTSAACPSFAAMVALLNQYLVSTGKQSKPGLANINPNLYHLAQVTPDVFHDVTTGSNIVPCEIGTKDCATGQIGYRAGPGYDLVTGWGSVDAYKLITGWSATSVTATSTSVSANPANFAVTASTVLTATVRASSGTLSPGGSVTFSLGGATLGTTALSGSGGSSTATLTVMGGQLSIGANSITAAYGGTTGFGGSSGLVGVTVTAATGGPTTTALAANPSSISSTASTVLTATVRAGSGTISPAGSVAFAWNGTGLGNATLSGTGGTATAALTVSGSQLGAGANSITAVYAGNANFGGSAGAVVVTVTVPATGTVTSVTASPSGIASTGNTVLTARVSASSGTFSPTGTVTFTLGNTTLGSASLTGAGGSATAAIAVGGSQLAAGANAIAATYGGNGGFAASSGTVTVNVTAAIVNTSTALTANPAAISTSSSTTLTATVTALTGSTAPAGQVNFAFGGVSLGTVTVSGAGLAATASLTVSGSRFAVGGNTVTAVYSGSTQFNGSSGSASVTVTVAANGAAVIPSVVPDPVYEEAPDSDGFSWFYTVRLSEIAGVAATLTNFAIDTNDYSSNITAWFGSATLPAHGTLAANLRSQLASSPLNRTFSFSGVDATGQKWAQQIVVPFDPRQISASMQVTSSPGIVVQNPNGNSNCSSPYQYYFQDLNLQEKNGYEVLITKFLAGGSDLTSNILQWFGSWRLAPLGTLQAGICWEISNPPTTLSYEIDGVDTAGNNITTTASIPFNLAPAQSGGALTASASAVKLSVSPNQSANAAVSVSVPAGQAWSASLFPANQTTSWLVVYPQSGTGPGTVNLVAAAAGLANGVYTATLVLQSVNTIPQFVNVPITFTIGGSNNVSISALANGASFKQAFAPGMILSVFGSNLSSGTQSAVTAPLPYSLQNTSASINGVPAPLYYVSPGQLNIQIPYEIPARPAVLAVNNNGQVATYSFSVATAAPGIFAANGFLVPLANSAPGQSLEFFITGYGDVAPIVASGATPTGSATPAPRLPLTVTVGGVAVTPIFVGLPGWSVGVTQVNIVLPANVPAGIQPVVVTVGGVSSAPVSLSIGGKPASVQFTFVPPSVNQSADGSWDYATRLTETNGVGVNFTKLTVFGNDYTSQLANWFGSTRLPANGTLSGNFYATCTCSPPWDGVWQITGTDDTGITQTWSGTVHFLAASTGNVEPASKPLSIVRGSGPPDALAHTVRLPLAVSIDGKPLTQLWNVLSVAGAHPPAAGARNGKGRTQKQ